MIIPLSFFLLLGASCACKCDKEMEQKRSEYGNPEEVFTYS